MINSPDVTTMCYCDHCKAVTRWSRHLDIGCRTIQTLNAALGELRSQNEQLRNERSIAVGALKDILKHQQLNGGNIGSVALMCKATLMILREEIPQ